jgi:hypothetical protein
MAVQHFNNLKNENKNENENEITRNNEKKLCAAVELNFILKFKKWD